MDDLDAATGQFKAAVSAVVSRMDNEAASTLNSATAAMFAAINRGQARERDMQAENAAMRDMLARLADHYEGIAPLVYGFGEPPLLDAARALLKGEA